MDPNILNSVILLTLMWFQNMYDFLCSVFTKADVLNNVVDAIFPCNYMDNFISFRMKEKKIYICMYAVHKI